LWPTKLPVYCIKRITINLTPSNLFRRASGVDGFFTTTFNLPMPGKTVQLNFAPFRWKGSLFRIRMGVIA
jgi:hypothetical protein